MVLLVLAGCIAVVTLAFIFFFFLLFFFFCGLLEGRRDDTM